jgi:hypothetical protein
MVIRVIPDPQAITVTRATLDPRALRARRVYEDPRVSMARQVQQVTPDLQERQVLVDQLDQQVSMGTLDILDLTGQQESRVRRAIRVLLGLLVYVVPRESVALTVTRGIPDRQVTPVLMAKLVPQDLMVPQGTQVLLARLGWKVRRALQVLPV